MGTFSIWHLLLIAVVVLVLFGGRGKLSEIMGDFAKGIKSFKKGLTEDEPPSQPSEPIEHRDETRNKDNAAH